MIVARTIAEARTAVAEAKSAGKTVGLVPTMGALHAGHFSLIDAAADDCDFVVVSLFVNPTQFAPGEDLETYPRREDEDLAGCEARGVDLLFAPDAAEMYPRKIETTVEVPALARRLCGADRPTHFAGVCTVVAKLLNVIGPDAAWFGQKDFQQCVILRRMVRDLDFPVRVEMAPTVREPDGLALSSRNAYLTDAQRAEAPALYAALQQARRDALESHPPAAEIIASICDRLARSAPDGAIDYVRVVDPETLQDVEQTNRPAAALLAVRFDKARLIDNIMLDV